MKTLLRESFNLLLLMYLYSIHLCSGAATDTITTTHFLRDGDANIASTGGTFEMGFFSSGNSENRYVGMWYKNISVRTVVWVANREAPLNNGSGVLKVIEPGLLVLLNGTNNVVWSTNTSTSVLNPIAQLLDSGSFWISTEHPEDGHRCGVPLWTVEWSLF